MEFRGKKWKRPPSLGLVAAGALALFAGCAERPVSPAARYAAWYEVPLTSPGTQFLSLPPAARRSVLAEAGTADIRAVTRQSGGVPERVVYRVDFQASADLPALYLSGDGNVLDPTGRVMVRAPHEGRSVGLGTAAGGLSLDDLPPPAVRTIQRTAPDAEIERIDAEDRAGHVVYRVHFRGRTHRELVVDAEGSAAGHSSK
jgi:hypothetical protein